MSVGDENCGADTSSARVAPVQLAVDRIGHGPPLVILHGLLGSGTNWRTQARTLAESFTVYLMDARNHGRSEHSAVIDYPHMALDLLHFMDAQGLASCSLIGHSMGGKTCMHVALHHPQRVHQLIVVDIAPAPSPNEHLALINVLKSLSLSGFTRRSQVDAALAGRIPDAHLRAFLTQNLVSDGNALRWRINLDAIANGLEQLVSFPAVADGVHYGGPTLFVRGERSSYIRSEHQPVMRRLFPAHELCTVAAAGHWVHAEQPHAFIDAVTPFLRHDLH